MQTRSSSNSPQANETPPLPPNRKKSSQATKGDPKAKGRKNASEPKCEWTADEEERLILFLLSEIASAADGRNFKKVTWTAAAVEMAKIPTKGPNKTATACSSKYAWVCTPI